MYVSKKVNYTFTSTGDGYWGLEPGVDITFTKINVYLHFWDDTPTPSVEIVAEHNLPTGGEENEWGETIAMNGLLYTDTGAVEALQDLLRKDPFFSKVIVCDEVYGSEQGMQTASGYSCDASLSVSGKRFAIYAKLEETLNPDFEFVPR